MGRGQGAWITYPSMVHTYKIWCATDLDKGRTGTMADFDGKVALVTGAGGAIGSATALKNQYTTWKEVIRTI